ncbi:MAG: DoxX family protein [Deltaproteobacteria bacterium]|nr:DoxX family protein [Deltaproteobacteria bacterium]
MLRVVAGLAFMFHGWGKIQDPFQWMGPESGMPAILQFLAAVSEFGGGLAWILGLLMPLSSLGIACTMAVAFWTHAVMRGDPFVGKGASYELALLYLALSLFFIASGPGKLSLDRLLFGVRSEG